MFKLINIGTLMVNFDVSKGNGLVKEHFLRFEQTTISNDTYVNELINLIYVIYLSYRERLSHPQAVISCISGRISVVKHGLMR